MGVWDSILKYGGKAMKGASKATAATGKSMGNAILHPSQTLRGAGQAAKTATLGGAVGYVGWKKLTTDESVARIVSDAVIGKQATDTLAGTADGVRELTGKAGEAVGNFFCNLAQGNVSGLSIAGLVAAAMLIFGRFGWLGKIAGAFLGMMLIGNNAGIFRTPEAGSVQREQTPTVPVEEHTHCGGMRR